MSFTLLSFRAHLHCLTSEAIALAVAHEHVAVSLDRLNEDRPRPAQVALNVRLVCLAVPEVAVSEMLDATAWPLFCGWTPDDSDAANCNVVVHIVIQRTCRKRQESNC